MKRRTCVSHDRRDLQALLCQPSTLDSHLPERLVHPLYVDSWYLLSFEPDGGYEMMALFLVRNGLNPRWVEIAIDGAAQAMFAHEAVYEFGICSGL